MNRRTFLGLLAGALPLGIAATPLRGRRAGLAAASAAAAPTGTSPGAAGTAPAASAPGGSRAIRYTAGLPIHRVRPKTVGEPCRTSLDVARRHIQAHCTDPSFANGVIHGVRALGLELPLGAGDPYRLILERYTQESYIEGQVFLEVPVHHEGHRHAMLKTLVERQCDLDLEFEHDGRMYRFRDYVESAIRLHTYDLGLLPIDEQSWTIMALSRVTPPSRARWANVYGQTIDLERMIDDTSEALRRDTRLVRGVDLQMQELPRDCPALARACGGLHMLYALAVALSSGYETPRRRQEFAGHMRTQMRRFTYDLRVIEQVEALNVPRVGEARARVRAFDGRLKFLGHSFEVIGVVDQFGLYEFSQEERAVIDAGRAKLCALLADSATMNLRRYKDDRVLFDSIVSGFCHAYNGLLMSPA
ncbi:MAG: hypothetical protein ACE5G2_10060 [Candidatus Krumholzibacteriia bacterium]